MDVQTYPTKRVLLSYALLGGLVGGLLFCIGTGFYLGFEQLTEQTFRTDLRALKDLIVGFLMIMVACWLVGLVPAFLTGLVLSETRTHWQIVKPFMIGAIITFTLVFLVYTFGFSNPLNQDMILGNLTFSALLAVIGGLSSVIVGKFILPKAKN